jgi:hypothetical protein
MTGAELRHILQDKWGCSYDVQLRRIGEGKNSRVQLQVMWRYLEQASFPMTEQEYLQHLHRVATYLQEWCLVEQFRQFIRQVKARPRLGKPVVMVLDLGDRAVEWLV